MLSLKFYSDSEKASSMYSIFVTQLLTKNEGIVSDKAIDLTSRQMNKGIVTYPAHSTSTLSVSAGKRGTASTNCRLDLEP